MSLWRQPSHLRDARQNASIPRIDHLETRLVKEDERYIAVDGKRWRKSDPAIPASLEKELVSELMSARRAVRDAKSSGDEEALRAARERVQDAKLALGERGTAWWQPQSNSDLEKRAAAAIRSLLRKRGYDKSICPSDAARIADGEDWRAQMPLVRRVAERLAEDGWLEFRQRGEAVEAPVSGPVRLARRA